MKRDSFGSRFGALVAMAGSAVGLGNLWRFPYLVGENGGAAFIIVYILLSFLICLPIFISEFVVGRRSQKNAYAAFRDLSGGSAWRWVGLLTIIVPLIVLSYYSVIGGWSVDYLFKSCTFSFTDGGSQSAMATMFSDMASSTWTPLLAHTGFLLVTTLIVVVGRTRFWLCDRHLQGFLLRISPFAVPGALLADLSGCVAHRPRHSLRPRCICHRQRSGS